MQAKTLAAVLVIVVLDAAKAVAVAAMSLLELGALLRGHRTRSQVFVLFPWAIFQHEDQPRSCR